MQLASLQLCHILLAYQYAGHVLQRNAEVKLEFGHVVFLQNSKLMGVVLSGSPTLSMQTHCLSFDWTSMDAWWLFRQMCIRLRERFLKEDNVRILLWRNAVAPGPPEECSQVPEIEWAAQPAQVRIRNGRWPLTTQPPSDFDPSAPVYVYDPKCLYL
ncbi:hypothetical protein BKA70DRAFT_1233304 [Coprinopsis sp. MPI-PUGE-AT-0042]|nr:hypothetical protein BKA70DRAFT_1233304 [Coprinopsis sp. MPI-PUGE-AT-0042]